MGREKGTCKRFVQSGQWQFSMEFALVQMCKSFGLHAKPPSASGGNAQLLITMGSVLLVKVKVRS